MRHVVLNLSHLIILVLCILLASVGCDRQETASDAPLQAINAKAEASPRSLSYNRDIRPILSDKCFACHGPDRAARAMDLRLDKTEDGADYFGAYSVIKPGDPDASELIKRIHSKKSKIIMPPPTFNVVLTDSEKQLLTRWIEQGAQYEHHWAFVPVASKIDLPSVKANEWANDDMDRFVLAPIEQMGGKPNKQSSRLRWLRRVSYDLTGLQPTPAEIDAFINDTNKDAYETIVDRLLASPHYGEHMATQWIDLARYADSYGYQSDQLSPTWPWRDWVVRSFNSNLPYDEFVIQQIAGDLLPKPTRDQQLATAFNRLHRMTNEGGSINEEWLNEYAADRVHTFGTAFMGLTLECARCHDHRYDPIEQSDYYELFAFFNSIDEWGTYHDSGRVPTPSLLLPNEKQEAQWLALQDKVKQSRQAYERVAGERGGQPLTDWLDKADASIEPPGLIAHFSLDSIADGGTLENKVAPENPGKTYALDQSIEGKVGNGIRLAGDAPAVFDKIAGGMQPNAAFTISFWLKLPREAATGIVFHRTSGTDVGYHGGELSLNNGRLRFSFIRFWPGNAISVQTSAQLPVEKWVLVTVANDGSCSAQGMKIFIDGALSSKVLRDNLYKIPQHGGSDLVFNQRFRGPSLPGVAIDELRAYNRALTPIEAKELIDGQSLGAAVQGKDTKAIRDFYLSAIDQPTAKARKDYLKARFDLLLFQTRMLEVPIMKDLPQPTPTYNLDRGVYSSPRTQENRVIRDTPGALPPMREEAPRDRLGLAQWLTDPGHPLTARVAVNRLWIQCFGNGLVATPDNFGFQGALPTHPELLDYLAQQFIASGWDTKAMLKRIVLSSTYRQDSATTAEQWAQDPGNQMLARGPSRRLSAEQLRDTVLAASGLLNTKIGGPPVAPYQPPKLWRESNSMSPAFRQSVGKDLYRRSLYTVWKRTAPMPNMIAFDAPGREVCVAKRSPTNTPLQALVLLNDVQFVEACRVLAERVLKDADSDQARLGMVFGLLASRAPDKHESGLLLDLLKRQRRNYAGAPKLAALLASQGEHKRDEQLDVVDVAAWTSLIQVVMNSDATVWRR